MQGSPGKEAAVLVLEGMEQQVVGSLQEQQVVGSLQEQ